MKQLRPVLENLYDLAYLQRHPFAELIQRIEGLPGETAGQCLRRVMLEVIEKLNPGYSLSPRHAQARAYHIIRLRYIEGMTIQDTAMEMGISERQAYRHLIDARDSMASILMRQYPELGEVDAIASLGTNPSKNDDTQPPNLGDLLSDAVGSVNQLSVQKGVEIILEIETDPDIMATVTPMIKQVLVSIISRSVQNTAGHQLEITLTGRRIEIEFDPIESISAEALIDPIVNQLVKQNGWHLQANFVDDNRFRLTIGLESTNITLLIIDDESDLGELIQRYLTGYPYNILVANTGWEGVQMARERKPDCIILDVMMPSMDGWEVLQRLKMNETTQEINVIVCSIFNDPELAYSLGAAGMLSKPLSHDRLLKVLNDVQKDAI